VKSQEVASHIPRFPGNQVSKTFQSTNTCQMLGQYLLENMLLSAEAVVDACVAHLILLYPVCRQKAIIGGSPYMLWTDG
jgi:hypothetical protein